MKHAWEQDIHVMENGVVLAECGPMRLEIRAWENGVLVTGPVLEAAEASFQLLSRVARMQNVLKLRSRFIAKAIKDDVAHRMHQSVFRVGDSDLTPLAAVAGTIADLVADDLASRGMTKVVVNNGGDISIRLKQEETVRVGLRPEIDSGRISHVLLLDGRIPSWGVTTSGVGGRSFTRGIASAVTTVAHNASIADAAATAIANACDVEDENVFRKPAERIDPNTDISGVPVTVRVGDLPEHKIDQALSRALHKAERLSRRGLILGAVVSVKNRFEITGNLPDNVAEIRKVNGDALHLGDTAECAAPLS
jgi:hypothetical protein